MTQALRITRHTRFFLAAFVLACALLLCGGNARAQEPGRSAGSEHSVNSPEGSKESRESREAREAEEEQAQFKHSWLVQLVAQKTGLSVDGAYWLCVVLNFAVIAVTLVYISSKKLPGVFRDRTTSIQKAMQEARQASEEANRRLAEIEARLSRLDAEIGGMRESAEEEAAAEEERIKAAALDDARKIVESAELEIAAAAKAARRELTAYAANLAVSLAAKQIKVDAATDQALVREFAQELSPKAGKGGN